MLLAYILAFLKSVLVKGKNRQHNRVVFSVSMRLWRLSLLFIGIGAKFRLAKLKVAEVVVFSISRGLRLASFPFSLPFSYDTEFTVYPRWHLLLPLAVQMSRHNRYLLICHKIRNPEYCLPNNLGFSTT